MRAAPRGCNSSWAVITKGVSMSTEVLDVPQAQSEGNEKWGLGTQGTALDLIRTKLESPNYQAWELMRLVTAEIARVVQEMRQLGFTVEEVYIICCLGTIIKALRELRHSIKDTESLRKKEGDATCGSLCVGRLAMFKRGVREDVLTVQPGCTSRMSGLRRS